MSPHLCRLDLPQSRNKTIPNAAPTNLWAQCRSVPIHNAVNNYKQSDIVGLLRRISQSREQGLRFFIVVTDLADTRYSELPRIPAPEGQVRVTIVLVPAQPKDALLTIGKALSGPEQFDLRARQLRVSAPWAAVVPYFAANLAGLVYGSTEVGKRSLDTTP